MPRHRRKDERTDTTDDAVDTDPPEWSDDEEDTSSGSETSSDVDVLKQLILHGFEVKGKLADGKLQYVFRTPKFVRSNEGATEDQHSNASSPRAESHRRITWADSLGSPPEYSPSRSLESAPRSVHNHRKTSNKKYDRPWIFT